MVTTFSFGKKPASPPLAEREKSELARDASQTSSGGEAQTRDLRPKSQRALLEAIQREAQALARQAKAGKTASGAPTPPVSSNYATQRVDSQSQANPIPPVISSERDPIDNFYEDDIADSFFGASLSDVGPPPESDAPVFGHDGQVIDAQQIKKTAPGANAHTKSSTGLTGSFFERHSVTSADVGINEDYPDSGMPEAARPILPQRGSGAGWGELAGLSAAAFEGFDPSVPPGSHYEPWVWRALDKPGHMTVELYVDQTLAGSNNESTLVHERTYRPKELSAQGASTRKNPQFDPARHVLVSVPMMKNAPWGVATRVLLVPETLRKEQVNKQQGFGREGYDQQRNENKGLDPVYAWVSDPKGIRSWLANDVDHNVVFGRVMLNALSDDPNENLMYWVVISREDARRVHKQVYGDKKGQNLDPEHRFGREGVDELSLQYDESINRRVLRRVALEQRRPAVAAQRYLGHWSNEAAIKALSLAQKGAGPQMPASWPNDDVRYVRQSHYGTLKAQERQAQNAQGAAIAKPKALDKTLDKQGSGQPEEPYIPTSSGVHPPRAKFGFGP